ncbi:unnamed protein product [Arctogadus glacialis]
MLAIILVRDLNAQRCRGGAWSCVTSSVPVEALLRRDVPACLKFLQSFKAFFDRQTAGRTYNALKGRKGRSIGPVAPGETTTVTTEDKALDQPKALTKRLGKND